MPRKQSVGPSWSPSAVWLKTTSRMTSMPARCSALTMSRNSSTGPSGSLPRAVGLVRREERDRLVAPVVDRARRAVLGVELEHRQQLDGGDAEMPAGRGSSRSGRRRCRASFSATPELGWRVKPRTCIS